MTRKEFIKQFEGQRVLMLQGPMGPFFHDLREDILQLTGSSVVRVLFNSADIAFAGGYTGCKEFFNDKLAEESGLDYYRSLIRHSYADCVILFGQERFHHKKFAQAAKDIGIPVGVFEEGYVRPNFISFEWGGVNASSQMPKNAEFYKAYLPKSPTPVEHPVSHNFRQSIVYATQYAFHYYLSPYPFKTQGYHRSLSAITAFKWVREWVKKPYVWQRDSKAIAQLETDEFWFVPLQTHNDAQILVHSEYASVLSFIDDLLENFLKSNTNKKLVLKHHPLDKAYTNYRRAIQDKARALGVSDRVVYLREGHTPTLIDKSAGVVVVNSTVGLQALFHGKPVKCLGQAIYDFEGLTFQGELSDFLSGAAEDAPISGELLERFKAYLIDNNQINDGFYLSQSDRSSWI